MALSIPAFIGLAGGYVLGRYRGGMAWGVLLAQTNQQMHQPTFNHTLTTRAEPCLIFQAYNYITK